VFAFGGAAQLHGSHFEADLKSVELDTSAFAGHLRLTTWTVIADGADI
jgi:hypothetical protein